MADCKTHQKLKIIVKPVPVSQYHKSKAEFYNQSREPYTQKGAHMDAAQILKPFANEHIPADTEKTATAEHTSEIITMQNVNKSYKMGSGSLHVLKDISLTVEQGEYLAILGPSGSGKSTLLHLIGGLDSPTSGEIWIDNECITKMSEEDLSAFRRRKIGFIFQAFNLVPSLNVWENIILPIGLDDKKPDMPYLKEIIEMLGLTDKLTNLPNTLSGGQQQRVAIARALATKPAIILADEPTGNLDSKTSDEVMTLLKTSAFKYEQTLIVITHNEDIAQMGKRNLIITDGKVVEE